MLSANDLDALRIIASQSAEAAACSLGRWLRAEVVCVGSHARLQELDAVVEAVDETATAALVVAQVRGTLTGHAALKVPLEAARAVVQAMGGRPPAAGQADFAAIERSMLQETANILITAYCNHLSLHMGVEILPHAPDFIVDFCGAAWSDLLISSAEAGDRALVLETILRCPQLHQDLSLHLVPDPRGITVIRTGLVA
jgi:chemotaxis protein CheY-P-specific phosphatase CheC